MMSILHTTLGPKTHADLSAGMILPHEHVFVDLRQPHVPGYAVAETSAVIALISPYIEEIKTLGITALVECTPVGVGRRIDILKAVSQATDFPLVVPTGIYREPWVPAWARAASEDALHDWMLAELTDTIEETSVQAAWIKLSAGDDGITAIEEKILRAAARAAHTTNALIGSHTIRGRVVLDQLGIIEQMGYTAERFVAIHASAEPDFDLTLAIAKRGAWVEFDWVGGEPDEPLITRILRLLDAGYAHKLLLSHDRGWFDPAQPGGGTPKPYTYLSTVFLPKLRAAGLDAATLHQITHHNPFAAFAR